MIISILIVINCLFIIVSINPVHSILFLVLVFLLVNILFILLNLDFLALIMLIIYVGALIILFLFIIMMLNIKIIEISLFKNKNQVPIGILIGFIFLIEIFILLFNVFFDNNNFLNTELNTNYLNTTNIFLLNFFNYYKNFSNIQIIGSLFYNSLFFFFLLGSLILLLAMIAAIALTLKKKKNIYSQKIFIQLLRDFNKTIQMN
jgi:NADH:ubiquinone oxidoreductase subunit 6 (subunit J)